MSLPKIMSGARAILQINDKPIAFATNVGYRIDIPHSAVNVLGRYSVARHEPVGIDVTLTCGVLRFTKATGQGNAADSIGTGNPIAPRVQDLINSEELKIIVIDRATNETIISVNRCRLTGRGGSLASRDLLSENWTFAGIIADDSDSGGQQESPGANTEAAQ